MKHGTLDSYVRKKCRCDECRAAITAYQRERRRQRPDVRAKSNALNKIYSARIKKFVREQKEGKPCTDCGVAHPWFVLQFDHRGEDPKMFMVSQAPSIAKAKEEIAKCDIVCANCHAVRTYNRRLTLVAKKIKL